MVTSRMKRHVVYRLPATVSSELREVEFLHGFASNTSNSVIVNDRASPVGSRPALMCCY